MNSSSVRRFAHSSNKYDDCFWERLLLAATGILRLGVCLRLKNRVDLMPIEF